MAANNKRASMREGPLAALFRKTEEEGLHGDQVTDEAPESEAAGRGSQEEPQSGQELRPAPPSARGTEGSRRADGLRDEVEPERRIPTPEERLRNVFSSDIPENIMDRPGASRRPYSLPALKL